MILSKTTPTSTEAQKSQISQLRRAKYDHFSIKDCCCDMLFLIRIFFWFAAYLMIGVILLPNVALATSTFELSGQVRVTKVSDGDSLRSGTLRIRIFGIDAPELKQQCQEQNNISWACGLAAQQKLRSLIESQEALHCKLRDVDRYGRLVMQCFQGDVDIGAEMVRSGHALAYLAFSKIYAAEEQHARSVRHGVWRGEFLPPWEWRRQN